MKSTLQYLTITTLTCFISTGCARTFTHVSSQDGEFSSAKLLAMAEAFEAQGDQQKAQKLHQAVQLRDPNRAYLTPLSTAPNSAPSPANQLKYTAPQLAENFSSNHVSSKPSLPEPHRQLEQFKSEPYPSEQLADQEEPLWEEEIPFEETPDSEVVLVEAAPNESVDVNEAELTENSARLTDALFARFSPFNETELTKLEAQENIEYAKIYPSTSSHSLAASQIEPVEEPQEATQVELVSANHPTEVNREYTALILEPAQTSDALSVPAPISNYDELESEEETPLLFIKDKNPQPVAKPQIRLAHFETETALAEESPAQPIDRPAINKPEIKTTAPEQPKTTTQPDTEIDSLDFELPNIKR